jgi:hypothetical protein
MPRNAKPGKRSKTSCRYWNMRTCIPDRSGATNLTQTWTQTQFIFGCTRTDRHVTTRIYRSFVTYIHSVYCVTYICKLVPMQSRTKVT